jgi:DNA primase
MQLMEETLQRYEAALTPEAAAWLMARGIEEEAALTFRLGVVAEPMPGHEKYEGMLAIPYLDKNGKPLIIRFRCLERHDHREFGHGKYNTAYGDPARMFNVRAVFEAGDEIAVTEGELDAIVWHQLGIPAVAFPGSSTWRGHHRRCLAGFSRVWVCGDPDESGAKFNAAVSKGLRQAAQVRLTVGDVNETYLQGGAEALLSLIRPKEED